MEHSFNIELAKEYGILEAILIKNIWFWIEKNRANEKNFYDGTYWTYNSTRAFNELFPYASESSIKRALKSLQEKGIIKTGNYNKSSYDRTLWYAFTDLGYSIVSNRQMETNKSSNGNEQNGLTIPDINTNDKITDIKTNKYEKPQTENACMDNISQLNTKELNTNDINNISSFNENDEELKKHFELIWDKYPNKTGKTKSKEYFYQWIKGKRISKETIKLTDKQMYYAVSKYAKECEEKGIEQQYIKHGDTFFNKAILDYVEADNE